MAKPNKDITLFFAVFLAVWGAFSSRVEAEEYRYEVMTVQGLAYLTDTDEARRGIKEGDTLGAGDILQTDPGSFVDLAYDPLWNNVTRVGENSVIRIIKAYPGKIETDRGSVTAYFEKLPKNSKFEIATPTAVAAVRGTSFRVTHSAESGTQISNLSKSKIEVYRIDSNDLASGASLFLDFGQAVKVWGPHTPDAVVEKLENLDGAEFKDAKKTLDEIHARVKEVRALGRSSQIPQPPDQGLAATDAENWRVKYLKRSELEDATYFDPSTNTAGVVEANMEFSPDQMFCLERGAAAEMQNSKTGEHYFLTGPFAAPTQKIPEAESGALGKNYSKTKVIALEGSVQTVNCLPGVHENVKVSEILLEAGKPFMKSGGVINEFEATPCGYIKKLNNPCQNRVKEYRWAWGEIEAPDYAQQYSDPPPLVLPRPSKRGSLEGQQLDE